MTEYCGLPLIIKSHPRAKRVLIKIIPGKGLEVVTPRQFDTNRIPNILNAKHSWITQTKAQLESKGVKLSQQPIQLPEQIEFRALNRLYTVCYLDRPGKVSVTENGPKLLVSGASEKILYLEALRIFTSQKARECIVPKVHELSQKLGLSYSALRIRQQKTRWGSCSGKGTISINAKAMFLPPKLMDQLLLHELCHIRHMNHSHNFWRLVARYQPDFKRLEHELSRGTHFVPGWF